MSKLILVGFSVLLLLVSAGCLSAKPTATLQECEQKPSISERDLCYKENAFSKKELTFCTQIIDANIRNNCINDFPS
jgi:hypothetical protein